jgi:16S rRNA (guanine527-N7)-methyltransferase
MDTARIAALLEPFLETPLSAPQLDQISIYIDLLLRWNARINLTAIRQEEEIVTRHFGESLFMARHLFPTISNPCHPERSDAIREADGGAESKDPYPSTTVGSDREPKGDHPHVLDIGSGAGFPAFPVKIWAPHIHLTLIESNQKKAVFLREVARALTLTDINVITDRTETLVARPDFPKADVVTLRAVEHFEKILPQAVTFLAPRGRLALLIGAAQIAGASTLTTVQWHGKIDVPRSHSRTLLIGYSMKSGQ